MLFDSHIIFFSFLFLWLISSFILLWSGKKLEIISILLNLLRLVLCSSMWSILEMFHVYLERMYILGGFLGCNVPKITIKPKFPIVSFRIPVVLLIFCLDLSIGVNGVLKSPTFIVFLLTSFMSVTICCMHLDASILGAYMLMSVLSSS